MYAYDGKAWIIVKKTMHAYAYRSEFLENKIVLKEKVNTNLACI